MANIIKLLFLFRDVYSSENALVKVLDGWCFLLGIGAGAGSSIFGFLTRSTLPEERAGIFAAVMACRQAGLLVGQFLPLLSPQSKRCHSHLSAPHICLLWNIRPWEGFLSCFLWCARSRRHSIKPLRCEATVFAHPPFISSLNFFFLSLQGRRSTCSCGCVISNWGPLLWTSIRLLG